MYVHFNTDVLTAKALITFSVELKSVNSFRQFSPFWCFIGYW